MQKILKILFYAATALIMTHSQALAAQDGEYEVKSITVKDSLSSTVINSTNKMQVTSLSGTATITSKDGEFTLNYNVKLSGIFLANPNLLPYSEIYGDYTFNNSDTCTTNNEAGTVTCKVPIQKNRTLQIIMEKMSNERR